MQDNLSLSEEEKLRRVKEAKGGTWYDGCRAFYATASPDWVIQYYIDEFKHIISHEQNISRSNA